MPYVDPNTVHNPTAGSFAPAAWGDAVRDALNFLANPPKVRVYNSANIAVGNATSVVLTFDSERFDTDTMHSTSVNTGRITFTTAGLYRGAAHVSFASNSTGYREVFVRVNGTDVVADDTKNAVSGALTSFSLPWEHQAAASDYVEVIAYQTSGGSLDVQVQPRYSPEFSAVWVSL